MLNETRLSYEFRGLNPADQGNPMGAIMSQPIRGEFLIHVDVATIMSNRTEGAHNQVVRVRTLDQVDHPISMRELAWDGPSRFVHHDFMRLPGTDVQNWIETDAPLTCWQDGKPMSVLSAKGRRRTPMARHIMGKWVIHIAAPVLIKNRAEGRNDPVIAIRSAGSDWAKDVIFARKVEWSGPTRMVHRPTTPIPGTNGRGISFIETDAVLTAYVDGRPPIVLYGWDNAQAAA